MTEGFEDVEIISQITQKNAIVMSKQGQYLLQIKENGLSKIVYCTMFSSIANDQGKITVTTFAVRKDPKGDDLDADALETIL